MSVKTTSKMQTEENIHTILPQDTLKGPALSLTLTIIVLNFLVNQINAVIMYLWCDRYCINHSSVTIKKAKWFW